jgi:uncharacterized protein
LATKRDKALLALQELDSSLDRLKLDLENMPEKQELNQVEEDLEDSRMSLTTAEELLTAIEHVQKKREDESKRLDDKIKNEERKLYAGTINNPKELMSLQEEIKVLSEEKDTFDTEYLIGLDELAKALAEETEIKNRLDDQTTRARDLSDNIESKTKELETSIAEAEEKRDAPLKEIDELTLRAYEQMRVKGHGTAVATAADAVCSGCHLENSEDSGHGEINGPVRRCEYCHRILITT